MHPRPSVRHRHVLLALAGVVALLMALLPLAAPPAAAQTDPTVQDALDLSGADPVAYAIAWSQVTYTPLTGDVENAPTEAVLGRDDLFADNLAAGSLMGQAIDNGRPLYLTPSDSLDAETLEEMQRVLPAGATVHILGGVAAISDEVEQAVTDAGFTVNRFEGQTRTETAVDIAEAGDSDTVLVVRAFPAEDSADETQAFADSLGAGALAATNGWEILFTQTDVLTGSTEAALQAGSYSQAYVVGGNAAVSDDVLAEVDAIVPGTERVDGATRFETAIALNELREGALGDIAILVDGQVDDAWADGFPAANFSGLSNYPLVLSNQGAIPAETQGYLTDFGDTATTPAFADHLTDVVLVCGSTVDEPTCQEALDIINGGEGGEVIPFPPTAGEGLATFTDAPELIAVDIEEMTADDVQLRFTFDEPVTGQTPVAECFHLYAFDLTGFGADIDDADCTTAGGGHEGDVNANPASADGTVAEIPADDSAAVLVTFDVSEEEFAAASVATVDWAAVLDDDGIENLEADIPLAAQLTGGTTAAPDLVEVRDFDADLDTVDFVFDEDVAAATIDPNGFVLIDGQGDILISDAAERSTVADEETVVVATFNDAANDEDAGPGIDSTTAGDIVRAGVLATTVVEDGGEASNPLQVIDLAADGATTDPDLVSIDVNRADDTVTYRFDEPVDVMGGQCASMGLDGIPVIGDATATPETCFQVYGRDGVEVDATAVERSTTNTDVVATFAEGTLDDALGASVEADAVSAVQGTENPGNEIDELPIEDLQIAAGATVGPDLVEVAVVTTDALGTQTVVEYTFDEDVVAAEPDPVLGGAVSPDATRFFIYDADGSPTRGETAQVDPDDANVVQVVFDENEQVIASAVTATVNDLAVVDENGDANPEGAGGALR